jgi:hypothetical protein
VNEDGPVLTGIDRGLVRVVMIAMQDLQERVMALEELAEQADKNRIVGGAPEASPSSRSGMRLPPA